MHTDNSGSATDAGVEEKMPITGLMLVEIGRHRDSLASLSTSSLSYQRLAPGVLLMETKSWLSLGEWLPNNTLESISGTNLQTTSWISRIYRPRNTNKCRFYRAIIWIVEDKTSRSKEEQTK